jgi:hypothetical protein
MLDYAMRTYSMCSCIIVGPCDPDQLTYSHIVPKKIVKNNPTCLDSDLARFKYGARTHIHFSNCVLMRADLEQLWDNYKFTFDLKGQIEILFHSVELDALFGSNGLYKDSHAMLLTASEWAPDRQLLQWRHVCLSVIDCQRVLMDAICRIVRYGRQKLVANCVGILQMRVNSS